MKKLLALLALTLLLFAGCTNYGPGPGNTNTTVNTTNNTNGTQSGTVDITISGFAFNPATITVAKGTTVRWINSDAVPHTVTADDTTNLLASGQLGQGATFEHTFDTPGTYAYHCSLHTYMKATVIVQ